MAIVINGSGTVTGLAVGGLPDGTVDDGTVASGIASSKLTGALPSISGASLTSVNAINGGRKNIIINGDMGVAQRGTQTGVTGSQYLTCDRWNMNMSDAGTWTYTQDTDVPAGQGFSHSLKMDCTTADASVASGSYMRLQYRPESQDLKQARWGTADAQPLVMSFWIKVDNATGDFCTDVLSQDNSNNRTVSQKFTYGSAGAWQKCVFTIPADTGGNTLGVDTGGDTYFQIFLQAGSELTSGTLNTTWATRDNTNRAAGQTLQAASSTSNNVYITGCQLELGSVATDFEYRSFGEELALCERYYEKSYSQGTAIASTSTEPGAVMFLANRNPGAPHTMLRYRTVKRAVPTFVAYSASTGDSGKMRNLDSNAEPTVTTNRAGDAGLTVYTTTSTTLGQFMQFHYTADAEL
jgi:hypothetical protein